MPIRTASATSRSASDRGSTDAGAARSLAGLDQATTVTIVGARRPSAYGLRIAEQLARELATAGVTVVSGMAPRDRRGGTPRRAPSGGATIAVLANGPDVVYPPVNRALYGRIVETGAAISEHPAGARRVASTTSPSATGSWPRWAVRW